MKQAILQNKLIVAIIVLVIITFSAWFIFGGNNAQKPMRQSFVVALQVYEETVVDEIQALGTAYANESINVTSNTTETIKDIHFTSGQKIKKGDLIVTLNHDIERARLSGMQAKLDDDNRELKRLEKLLAKRAASQKEFDQRKTSALISKEEMKALQAEIDERKLIAPFDGFVGIRRLSIGSLVQPGSIITTLDDTSIIKIDFSLPSIYLSQLELGQTIKVKSDSFVNTESEPSIEGIITAIDMRIDPVTRSILVRAEVKNPDGKIKPGALMKVSVHQKPRNTIIIPEESIIQRADKHFVFLLKEDTVHQTEITIGSRKQGIVEVVSGLQVDDKILVRGMGEVRNAQKVTVKDVWTTIQNSQFEKSSPDESSKTETEKSSNLESSNIKSSELENSELENSEPKKETPAKTKQEK